MIISQTHVLDRITGLVPVEQMERGLCKAKRAEFRRLLMDLADRQLIQRFRFGGRLCVAPFHWGMGDAEATRIALGMAQRDTSGCLIWSESVDESGAPRMYVGRDRINVRRAVYASATGANLSAYQAVRMRCGSDRCLDVHHMVVEQRSAVLANKARPITVCKRIADTKRKALSYTMELIRELRQSFVAKEVSQQQVATQLGVSLGTAGRILRGDAWRDFENPYTALMGKGVAR